MKVDGLELRLDLFDDVSPEKIAPLMVSPTIFTWKDRSLEGLKKLLTLEPAFVDLDVSLPLEEIAAEFPKTKIIRSVHFYDHTPEDLDAVLTGMESPFAIFYKIAGFANASLDSLRMLKFVKKSGSIGLCMGEKGALTRILAPIFGTPWVYAGVDEENQVAPGQLSVDTLQNIYNYSTLSQETKIYALLGRPVSKSPSYLTHNKAFKSLNINATYVKIDLEEDELAPFFTAIRDLPFCGLSVTMPYKEQIFAHIQRVDPKAAAIGAINTLVKEGNGWLGANTDADGALDALERHIPIAGKKVVILGAGGAAKAIAYEGVRRGASVTIQNRTEGKAQALAEKLGCAWGPLAKPTCDILINTTPLPMPISESWLTPTMTVMDISTSKHPPLLAAAQAIGCPTVSGFEMFILQAAGQYALWFPNLRSTFYFEGLLQ